MYIAHRKEGKEDQLLINHLRGVAELAAKFAAEFGHGDYGYLCGLLHDIGKYSDKFQKKIKGNTSDHCDHSTAGAILAQDIPLVGRLLSYCIIGHHGGLRDGGTHADAKDLGTLCSRLSDAYIAEHVPDFAAFKKEITFDQRLKPPHLKLIGDPYQMAMAISLFTRMIFSSLVDSDFIDTERFMTGEIRKNIEIDVEQLLQLFNQYLAKFNGETGLINEYRANILRNCINASSSQRGMFSLNVPTGGGKTLSSMAFALHHAKLHKMRRIIYVIPYTSIIDQVSEEFEKIFGEEVVLEHHSNYEYGNDEDLDDIAKMKRLATENWAASIVVTTNVQFFESLFSNKPSKCRKLHSIARSVVIFDEAHLLPINLLKPALKAVEELVRNYHCSTVFCTATQPVFDSLLSKDMCIKEIIDEPKLLQEVFKRTTFVDRGILGMDCLVEEIKSKHQVLVVVNTKKHAADIAKQITGRTVFHLSTWMCPAHRKDIIKEIKRRLHDQDELIVISTRLIEAGVDVDFPIVYRVKAGLDSMIQAAGRCNRNGKLTDINGKLLLGEVHLFDAEEGYLLPDNQFKREKEMAKLISQIHQDITSIEAIRSYYTELYALAKLDTKDIMELMKEGNAELLFPFEEIAAAFKLIENDTCMVIIPFNDEARKLIADLSFVDHPMSLLKKLRPYTVAIYQNEFMVLHKAGLVKVLDGNVSVLLDKNQYDFELLGLKTEVEHGLAIFH